MAPDRAERRLAAILAADMVGYSRLMEADEAGTIARQKAHRGELIDPKIAEYGGRIVKTTGDGLLAEFASVVDAAESAVAIQQAMAAREAEVPEDRRIRYRVGINLGDVVIDGDDILGDGVNVAARLEALCVPGGVALSGTAHEQVRGKLDAGFEDAGEHQVKNIARPIQVWRWSEAAGAGPAVVESAPLPLPDKPSIAVLPFDNLSGDPDQEFFGDGIAEDIITGLSRNHAFFVIARNSSFTYKGKAVDVTEVSRDLGVRYLLEGSVRKAGTRVRISAQLIDATTGNHVWAERYDRELDDIFAVQDEITKSIVGAVAPEMLSAEIRRARRKGERNLDAWECVMRAHWYVWRATEQDNAEAKRYARQAMELDPGLASGPSVLAICHIFDAFFGRTKSPPQALSEAQALAQRAVELDDRDAEAHRILGSVALFTRRFDEAVRRLEMALEIDPNSNQAHTALGLTLALGGNSNEAVERLNEALRLSPRDPSNYQPLLYLGLAAFAAERYDDAIGWATKALDLHPDYPGIHRLMAASCGQLGRIDEAQAALKEFLRVMPDHTIEKTRAGLPWKDPERYLEGLRKAGMPEK